MFVDLHIHSCLSPCSDDDMTPANICGMAHIKGLQAIANVVDLMDKYNMGYCSVNHNRNRCMDCGYEDATDGLEECPNCHSHNIDRLQRITGYLVGTTDRWNSGKLAELKDRVVHK